MHVNFVEKEYPKEEIRQNFDEESFEENIQFKKPVAYANEGKTLWIAQNLCRDQTTSVL